MILYQQSTQYHVEQLTTKRTSTVNPRLTGLRFTVNSVYRAYFLSPDMHGKSRSYCSTTAHAKKKEGDILGW